MARAPLGRQAEQLSTRVGRIVRLPTLDGDARVSTTDRALTLLEAAPRAAGGWLPGVRAAARPGAWREGRTGLDLPKQVLSPGDALVITRLDRLAPLARSLKDVENIVPELRAKGVRRLRGARVGFWASFTASLRLQHGDLIAAWATAVAARRYIPSLSVTAPAAACAAPCRWRASHEEDDHDPRQPDRARDRRGPPGPARGRDDRRAPDPPCPPRAPGPPRMLAWPRPDPTGPGQESAWAYPRPPRAEATRAQIVIAHRGLTLVDTTRAVRVLETSHPPTYYVPPEAVRPGLLRPAGAGSVCEWKGRAAIWDAVVEDEAIPGAAWSYPSPTPAFAVLRDHLAFYAGPFDRCTVDGEAVTPQPGRFYGGWITRRVAGPFKGTPGSEGW